VIAVGPGAPNKDGNIVAPSVKAGDKVLLPGWGGNSIKMGEEVKKKTLYCNLSRNISSFVSRSTSCSRTRKSWQKSRNERGGMARHIGR